MAGFNQAQFDSDKKDLLKEIRSYNLHKDKEFREALNGYLDQLQREGNWIKQGLTPEPSWVGHEQVNALINRLDKIHAFHVPAKWWAKNKGKENFRDLRREVAAETSRHAHLWSKIEPGPAAKRAEAVGGGVLESGVAGKLMNNKGFGFETWSDSPTMGKLWEDYSLRFVDGVEGVVKGMVLNGVVDNSVMTRLEWPHLRKMIEDDKVPHLRVSVMNIVGDKSDSRTWTLQTVAGFDVRSQKSFDALPKAASPEFWSLQQRWHNRQKAEAAASKGKGKGKEKASSGSSDVYSLKNFHKVFDQPDTVVVLSDPNGPDPTEQVLTASPEQLSRVMTNLTRTSSSSSAASRSSGAKELAAVTLEAKLNVLAAEQAQRASDSSSAEMSLTSTHGQYDMSQMTTKFAQMAPYASGGAYDTSEAGPSNYYAGSQAPSTDSPDSTFAPLEPVNRVPSDPSTAAYMAGGAQEGLYYPSTVAYATTAHAGSSGYHEGSPQAPGSDSSGSFGYPLEPVNRVPSDPSTAAYMAGGAQEGLYYPSTVAYATTAHAGRSGHADPVPPVSGVESYSPGQGSPQARSAYSSDSDLALRRVQRHSSDPTAQAQQPSESQRKRDKRPQQSQNAGLPPGGGKQQRKRR